MLNQLPIMMVKCLALTIIIEGIFALIIGIRDKTDLLFTALVNCLTNPVIVVSTFLTGYFLGSSVRMPLEYTLEALLIPVEGFVYYKTLKYRKINPFMVALILNAGSYFSGLIIGKYIF